MPGGKPYLDKTFSRLKSAGGDAWEGMNALQKASLLTSPVPLVPDALGLLGDMQQYVEQPESRGLLNYGLSALGLLPFIPAGVTKGVPAPEVFHRFTHGPKPESRGGHMLFASDFDKVANSYGGNYWVADSTEAVDVKKLLPDFEKALKNRPELLDAYQSSAKQLADSFDPEDIVNSAGAWDAEDLIEAVYLDVLEPKGISKVQTADGLVVFDPSLVTKGILE